MAAPSGTVWGSAVNNKGRIGIYKKTTVTETTVTLDVQVWFWSVYSCTDSNFSLYFNDRGSSGSATTKVSAKAIKTTSNASWSNDNQQRLYTYTEVYTRGAAEKKRYLYSKLSSVEYVDGTMYANTTVSIPALSGLSHIDNGSGHDQYEAQIEDGTAYERYIPYIDNGSGWEVAN